MEQIITKRKVLIVDDEPNVRHLSRTILSKKFDVFEAEDGKQALEIANIQQPDVILMDMMMPQDGWTDCLLLDQERPSHEIHSSHHGYGHWF
jgi:two-component system, OmpR family, response regulator ResD